MESGTEIIVARASDSLDEAPDEKARDDSDVFVCQRAKRPSSPEVSEIVTLFVYGWHNVQPGPLSWAFPSLRAALSAVKTMRNAIAWSIVSGSHWASVEEARARGAILVEEN